MPLDKSHKNLFKTLLIDFLIEGHHRGHVVPGVFILDAVQDKQTPLGRCKGVVFPGFGFWNGGIKGVFLQPADIGGETGDGGMIKEIGNGYFGIKFFKYPCRHGHCF